MQLSPTDVTARNLLAQVDQQQTQTPASYVALSLQRYNEGRYQESIAACQSALQFRSDYAEAWNNICAAYNKIAHYEEEEAACEEALRYKPDFELARNNLAYAREMLKAK